MGDLMSRKALSDQTAVRLSPTAPRPLSVSVPWFCCFPFPEAPGKARGGKNKESLPAFQHIPAPNAWAQPHIAGILSLKGAALLCLSTEHHSVIYKDV